ncbi:sulfite reductase flavo protein alpha-component [Eremomyces bilateralis CBS 781.70]|uniref:assimilatory sulfite reductase (NADPH) n=1 Tax=Eremomyces bilateralis CBS 781.70 TaxID=1392243 RepID=A0A6G1G284_9PEZI|nr:sulfite reductase flavo protein alpha-component [Eremomyces bilateralis CBS 781.70]KAF1812128.1 sulfite reductase flavo protein alpha-component [Eremomyces bilateralis CBS 781.70]
MHLQDTQSTGPSPLHSPETLAKVLKTPSPQSSTSLPFGRTIPLSTIGGPTYVTAQTLAQHVAYTLSDKIFTYSPESFDLDIAIKSWNEDNEKNAFDLVPGLQQLQARAGAGSIALGYMFSNDFDLSKRHIPQTIVASSATLELLRPSLDQLSLLYSLANPLVAHVAAVELAAGKTTKLFADYTPGLRLAEELGLGLVSSTSVYETQHMALLATLLADVLPTIHMFDGVAMARETTRVVDILDQHGVYTNYQAIKKAYSNAESTHLDNDGKVLRVLKAFNDELGTEYKPFEFFGHESAESVLVTFGSAEASIARQVATKLSRSGQKVGVINVRVYRPFIEEAFLEVLPKTAKRIAILGQVSDESDMDTLNEHSMLFNDVLATVNFFGHSDGIDVVDLKYVSQTWTAARLNELIQKMAIFEQSAGIDPSKIAADEYNIELVDESAKQYSFLDSDRSATASLPSLLGELLAQDSSSIISTRTAFDHLAQGGVVRTDIRSSTSEIEAPCSTTSADSIFVGSDKLLKDFDFVRNLKHQGTILIWLPGVKDEDVEKKVPEATRKAIAAKTSHICIIDSAASAAVAENKDMETQVVLLAVIKVLRPDLYSSVLQNLGNDTTPLEEDVSKVVRDFLVPEEWSAVELDPETPAKPADITINSFVPFKVEEVEGPTAIKSWHTAAQGLLFKEAYGTQKTLRPDLAMKTHVVTVKERRRLTPDRYDRNIFHIEFDLGTSGLTYAIGEALGIHAENDADEVSAFMKWYNLDHDDLVEVPTREDPSHYEVRTAYQALRQNIDIFGRPPKRFYEALSDFATDPNERASLLALSTADGAAEFKRRAEVDTITFADTFQEFPSAHPPLPDLARIVPPMKRREYSIASSQRVTPTSVALLIVTVGWVDPAGRDRFGQATRFLNALPVGAPVVVSVKPSVMKLPASSTAPIIMAGLGTGLAPFRAFVQERALQRSEGQPIGPVLLYMGSRTQREEYLYGEEWEAYQAAGVITLIGKAFSRDQPHKIYIQDRMRETMAEIREAYLQKEGSFYLCGPTWPVPDVTEVLQAAVEEEAKAAGTKKVDSRREIERLKDDGRYVLEVY